MINSSRQVFITGGSSGLGLETARQFAELGWQICLFARDENRLEQAREGILDFTPSAMVMIQKGDVRDDQSLKSAISEFVAEVGGLEAVVHAAGQMRALGPIGLTDADSWRADIETSLIGAGNLARVAAPWLEQNTHGGAFVVFVGSGHHEGLGFGSGFSSAQAGLVRLMENLALERKWPSSAGQSPSGFIGYYALYPAVTQTGLMNYVLANADGRKWLPRFTELFGEGKEVEPQVPAATAVWLCQRKPTELTGRVVSGMLDTELMELRLAVLGEGDKGRLRLKF